VTNWPEYNATLKRRGDFTMWFTEEAIAQWRPAMAGARGRPIKYSDVAIETALFLRQVFHLALRQTEGFMNSLARVLKVEISIPDFSCISKRSTGLPKHALSKALEPGSVLIADSTGLKVYGRDEWHQESMKLPPGAHGASCTWRSMNIIKFLRAN
jgi:hypothetical protein